PPPDDDAHPRGRAGRGSGGDRRPQRPPPWPGGAPGGHLRGPGADPDPAPRHHLERVLRPGGPPGHPTRPAVARADPRPGGPPGARVSPKSHVPSLTSHGPHPRPETWDLGPETSDLRPET